MLWYIWIHNLVLITCQCCCCNFSTSPCHVCSFVFLVLWVMLRLSSQWTVTCIAMIPVLPEEQCATFWTLNCHQNWHMFSFRNVFPGWTKMIFMVVRSRGSTKSIPEEWMVSKVLTMLALDVFTLDVHFMVLHLHHHHCLMISMSRHLILHWAQKQFSGKHMKLQAANMRMAQNGAPRYAF